MENSEHVKKETPESPKNDHTKELSEEWNEQRTTSEEQLRAGEQVDESGSVLKAEEKIEQLTIQSYDPNSEHIKEETPASLKNQNIKEPSEEWDEQQRATSEEQLNAGKKVKLGSVQETKEGVIEQLNRELREARITIENLESKITSLNKEKSFAELANVKLRKENKKIEELHKKIDKLEGALQCEKKKVDQLKSVLQCEKEKIDQLESDLQREREKIDQLEGVLQCEKEKVDQLESVLQCEIKKSNNIPQNLQRRQPCSKDCGLCCLLWICDKKLQKYPCGPHLRTLITIKAERELGPIEDINLRCEAFVRILLGYEVLNMYPKIDLKRLEMDDNRERYYDISRAWVELMSIDKKERAVIIGSQFLDKNKMGHCWVCDLETNSRKEGRLTIYDPQYADSMLDVNKEGFRTYAEEKKVDGVFVFTVNFDNLKKIIKDHEKNLMHATSNDCETYYTDSNCMSRSPIPTESSDEP